MKCTQATFSNILRSQETNLSYSLPMIRGVLEGNRGKRYKRNTRQNLSYSLSMIRGVFEGNRGKRYKITRQIEALAIPVSLTSEDIGAKYFLHVLYLSHDHL